MNMEKSMLGVRTNTQDRSSGDIQQAVINAADNCEPGRKNKTNWNLGEFLLSIRDGAMDPNKYHLRFFHSIGLSIAHLNHWFHPEGWNGWRSVVNMALVEQTQRFREASRDEIKQLQAENRLRFFYPAIRNREVDEIRKQERHAAEVQFDNENPLHNPPHLESHPDGDLQRGDVIALIERAKEDFKHDDGILGVLSQVQAVLVKPDLFDTGNCRADIVKRLAKDRAVSPQQARLDLRRFRELAVENESIQRIARQLRGVVRLDRPCQGIRGQEPQDDLHDSNGFV